MPEEHGESTIECPVRGCDYYSSPSSVAAHVSGTKDSRHDWSTLGYEGFYEFKQEHAAEQGESTITVVHMTDSHIGREDGGHGERRWEVNCKDGFENGIEAAVSIDVDAVVHTGDLFHNDLSKGITEDHRQWFRSQLRKLDSQNIPFYYVLGDHEMRTQEGKTIREEFANFNSLCQLSEKPTFVGNNIALYGMDHHSKTWWANHGFKPKAPPNDRPSILAIHQSMKQFVNSKRAECDARSVLNTAFDEQNFFFDVIAVGQHHKDRREEVLASEVLCGGATERISQRSFDPFVRVFSADETGLSHRKILL